MMFTTLWAALRAAVIVAVLAGFFLIGVPTQWLISHRLPRFSRSIPSFFSRVMLALLRVEVVCDGVPAKDRPLLIAANHVSWIDILAFNRLMPACFLAKKDIEAWPIISAFAEVQGTVFVDRARRRSIPTANRRMAARMREGRPVVLFPEGTTVAPPVPGRFRSSHFAAARDLLVHNAAETDVALQPTAIRFSSDAAAWIGDDDLLSHLWRTLRDPPVTCFVSFGTPLRYTRATDRKIVAVAARDAIVDMLDRRRPDAYIEPSAARLLDMHMFTPTKS